MLNKKYKMYSQLLILFLLNFSTLIKADTNEINLTIDAPTGTLFSGEKAQFLCIVKNLHGHGELIWHWHFANQSKFYIIGLSSIIIIERKFKQNNVFI